jgi:phosphate transport system substrate-binding protein
MTTAKGRRRAVALSGMVAAALLLISVAAACGSSGTSGTSATTTGGGSSSTITGAGATFPAPLYTKWAADYNKISGIQLNYQAVGSGAGIQAIEAKTVEFGASDAPLAKADLDKAGLTQFPLTMGGVVMAVNITGISDGQLKLDGPTLAKIFMGDIKTWNDPAIKALNAGVQLSSTAITVVHRSDSSGTTFIFTSYLSAVSPQWKSKYGASKDISWAVGVGGNKNAGVATAVQQTQGAIGYVEYAYVKQTGMVATQLKNKDGQWVKPSLDSFAAAAAKAVWDPANGFATILVDEPGPQTWPITGASFILVPKDQQDADKARTLLQFFDWAYKNGQADAQSLDYVPIPANVVTLVENQWSKDITVSGTPAWP